MNQRNDPNPFDEEEPEVNSFSNGAGSRSCIPKVVANTLGIGQKHDANVDIPLDNMSDQRKKEKELANWEADLSKRERESEKYLSDMVVSKALLAKNDRPMGFQAAKDSNDIPNSWASRDRFLFHDEIASYSMLSNESIRHRSPLHKSHLVANLTTKMESSRVCKSCRSKTLVPDDVSGNIVCSSCGVVQDYDNFQAQIGGITGPIGTYVRVGTSGSGSVNNFKENKIFEAQKLIEDLMFKLGLTGSKGKEVRLLIEKITEREYGMGQWFPVFVGTCAYVVMRKDHKMLPIVEVADLVGCDVHELGRMIGRVVDFVDLKLPEFDIVYSFERAVKSCPSFGGVGEDVLCRMLKQGVFLVQCLIKWFVTTGRRPMPVVAAVMVLVGELNQVSVRIEDVAKELHVAVTTCRRRYRELLERLVVVAQVLPWGKDVTMKNILKNAPFVIQYMEMKSMNECNGGERKSFEGFGFDMEGLVGDCLRKGIENEYDSYSVRDSCSSFFEADRSSNLSVDYSDRYRISPEYLTMIYLNYLDDISAVKAAAGIYTVNKRKRHMSLDLQTCTDWWKGQSDLSKKLLLKQLLEKDVGLDARPPSFDKGCLVVEQRREKIKAAKLRIQRIMHPGSDESGYSKELCVFELGKSKMKKKKMKVGSDWEELIIETLLLHKVKEEEIEKGHYNALLALHVFDH